MKLLFAALVLAGLWTAVLHLIAAPRTAWIAVCLVGTWAVLGLLDR
jgi:hypothetical protein